MSHIKAKRHGVPIRVKSNGLFPSKTTPRLIFNLKEAGLDHLTVHLASDNPAQYMRIMQPTNGTTFDDACAFIIAAVDADIPVTCTAVEQPEVSISGVRALAESLGAVHFRSYKYFP